MNKIKKLISLFIVFAFFFILTSCAAKNLNIPVGSSEKYPSGFYDEDSGTLDGKSSGLPAEPGETYEPDGDNQQIPAGQITASAWDDKNNYPFWLNLFASSQESAIGLFEPYEKQLASATNLLYSRNMLKVAVTSDAAVALKNAKVVLSKDQNTLFRATTDAFGNAYIFLPKGVEYPVDITVSAPNSEVDDQLITLTTIPDQNTVNVTIANQTNSSNNIDLLFVVDTTGSMGDEIDYLKAEISSVIEAVSNNGANVRLGLLFYRDAADEYVTRKFDFTTNLSAQYANLRNQFANGGGDYPEAVDVALDEAINDMTWSADDSTKLLVHVLDAPPHTTNEKLAKFAGAVTTAAQKGIRIIPVASSGIDKWTEYLLRLEAMTTGGIYTFITNDSGIGGDHIEASVGETTVEFLNAMLIRIINSYHTGTVIAPVPYNQTIKK